MNEQDVFVLADTTLKGVVDQIRDDQWDLEMPEDFAVMGSSARPTLRAVIASHAHDEAWVPDMVAGRTMDEVGKDAYDGDLLGADPKAAFAALVQSACAAVRELDDLDRTVHCSFGDYPAREYLWQVNGFRGLRAHDLALVIGQPSELPPDLVQGLWDEISPVAGEWRSYGVFGPEVPVPPDAPLLDRLLGVTGRQPRGTS